MLVALGGLHEWNRLTLNSTAAVLAAAAALAAIGLLLIRWPAGLLPLAFLAAAIWFILLIDLFRNGMQTSNRNLLGFGIGVLTLGGTWAALVYLHGSVQYGPPWVIAAMATVWAADSFAYFCGKAWGKHKLAPTISPGKTIEGVLGGLAGAGILAAALGALILFNSANQSETWKWILACIVAALVSVGGDLYESRLKRQAGVKDSGALLPGHGGVLDRIDGLIPAMPVLVVILELLW